MKNLKNVLFLSTALLLSTGAQAQWETNWLLGIEGGWGQTSGNLNVNMTSPTGKATSVSEDLNNSGYIWGFLGGYQARCNQWLAGLELNVDWQNKNAQNNFAFTDAVNAGWYGDANFKRETTVGLTARGGYAVAPWFLPYIRLGIETSRDKLNYAAGSTTNITVAESGSHRSYRFVGGVGVEMPIPALMCLSLRLEYDYHGKGSAVNANSIASDSATFVSTSTKQHNNTGIAALVWNFL